MDPQRKSRKRKKSFVSRVRKYAKKRTDETCGLNEELYEYFIRIYKMEQEGFTSDEEKAIFAKNALQDTVGIFENMSMDGFLSRVLEKLIPLADESHLIRFTQELNDIRVFSTHRYASHVLETLIKTCADRFRTDGNQEMKDYVVKVSEYIFNSIVVEETRTCPQANQVARTCMCECAGYDGEGTAKTPIAPNLVKLLAERCLEWSLLQKFIDDDLLSGFAQCLFHCLSTLKLKILQKYIKTLLDECFIVEERNTEEHKSKASKDDKKSELCDEVKLKAFKSMASVRLLEAAIEVADKKRYTQIYANLFINRLKALSCNNQSFFAVQKLVSNCREKVEFDAMMSEISPHFVDVLNAGHVSVLIAFANGCKRFGCKEGEFLKALKGALKVGGSSRGELTCRLIFPDGRDGDKVVIDKNGSLLIQTMCHFKKPISVVEDLLSLDSQLLKTIFLDPKGSFISNAFVDSPTIGEKSRGRMIMKLKGFFREMALSKHGSRSLEAFWSRASLKEKYTIMSELDRTITTKPTGSIIAVRFGLEEYLRDKNKWSMAQQKKITKS